MAILRHIRFLMGTSFLPFSNTNRLLSCVSCRYFCLKKLLGCFEKLVRILESYFLKRITIRYSGNRAYLIVNGYKSVASA